MVFTSNDVKISLNTGADNSTPTWTELKEVKVATKTNDLNVDERDTFDSIYTKRTATGGKKMDFSFEITLDPADAGHKAIRDIVFSDDIKAHNDKQIQFEFPKDNSESETARTETYIGVIKPTADGTQASLELAVLNFDFMSSGNPVIVEEA